MFIADFHIHSKYSRATSKAMDLDHLADWAKLKGISLLGTGDFTHHLWLQELKSKLKPAGNGLFSYRGVNFILTTEVSNIYTKDGRGRRIHNVLFAPDFATVEKINDELSGFGNLSADGRPMLGLDCPSLVEIILGANPDCFIVPAHCLPPQSRIHTKDGLKKIKDIYEGEKVYTHKSNWKKVTKVLKRDYNGKIYHIRPYYFRNGLKATPEHPFYAIKTYKNCPSTNGYCRENCSQRRKGCRRRYYEKYRPQWIQAKDLKNSDVLVFPRFKTVKDVEKIQISDYVENYVLKQANIMPDAYRVHRIPNEIKVNKEFCKLTGYYLSEGYTNSRDQISFCFHDYEVEHIKSVKTLMKKTFGLSLSSHRVREDYRGIELNFCSKILVQLFGNLFYSEKLTKRAHSKCMPDWMLGLPVEKQAEIVKSWWVGDTGYTSSRLLMNQMKVLFLRLGVVPSIRTDSVEDHKRRGRHKIGKRKVSARHNNYSFSNLSFFNENLHLLNHGFFQKFNTKLKRRHGWIDESYVYIPIRDIEITDYEGEVYNLEVEDDNSYVCEFATVHNCWTPWYSVFGSNSGFDSIEECFEQYSKDIYALETGLSSDPGMNWRWSALDRFSLISNSDAHSASRIGREANVFDCEMDYYTILDVLKKKDRTRFLYTVEFFPEEGKYHFDGHRNCKILYSPAESRKSNNICPVCGRSLTMGVMHRVEKLSDRPEGFLLREAIPFKNLIPLDEIIAEAKGVGKGAQSVEQEYRLLVQKLGSELDILINIPEQDLIKSCASRVAQGILNVRRRRVKITPGHDGVYGKIEIFGEEDKKTEKQMSFF